MLVVFAVLAWSAAAQARITNVVVEDRKSPAYVAAVRAAAQRLVGERMLLPDDAERIVKQAADSLVLKP
jgi:hypothetical protein